MVNFLHNITALAGAATLCKIVDFQSHVINLSANLGSTGNAVIGFPETAGAANENVRIGLSSNFNRPTDGDSCARSQWFIVPQAADGTFTVQSASQPSVFLSYPAIALGLPSLGLPAHSGVIASTSAPTVFRMETVNSGPAVKFVIPDLAPFTFAHRWLIIT
jgi:hypothetical protein